jgi:hypothetical protein
MDFRGIFWTNPFNINFSIPLGRGYVLGAGNLERFNQSFDVYLATDSLTLHSKGEGGIEELSFHLSKNFNNLELNVGASYLLGRSREIWTYMVGDYAATDTFLYNYHGEIFSGGLRWHSVSVIYEGFGQILMEKETNDTTINLPARLGAGFSPTIFGGKADLWFEHSFWQNSEYTSPNRLKIGFSISRVGLAYFYSPWYLKEIQSQGIEGSFFLPIKNFGGCNFLLKLCYKHKEALREFQIIPRFTLSLTEIFARRKSKSER